MNGASSQSPRGVFKTPPRKENLKTPPAPLCRTPIQIPPSPLLEKLGYGTGVNVFKINRKAPGADLMSSPWAIKRLIRHKVEDLDLAKRLESEAEILQRLHHPNIVGFRGIQKQEDGRLCLAMEEGGVCLMDLIEQRNEDGFGPYPAEIILNVALGIARALAYLHDEHQLAHGDIKSQNILIKGDFDTAKLCDFGTSVDIGEDGIITGEYLCSEPWSPPEVHAAELSEETAPITSKADIFSFGLVLWEMIALCAPHMHVLEDDESFDEDAFLNQIGTRPDLPDEDLDASYDSVLSVFYSCTENDANKRPNAHQLVEILEAAVENAAGESEGVTRV